MSAIVSETSLQPPPLKTEEVNIYRKILECVLPVVLATYVVSSLPLFDRTEIRSEGTTWYASRWHAYAPSSPPARYSATNVTISVDRVATKLIGKDLILNFVLLQEWTDARLVVVWEHGIDPPNGK
ncbi:hypothetical protein Fcan01_24381 [Folsomia candida]|uniref:Uncharacterized protein n=1 Tax=Folsomia candida TaxID=158441 RepID=A0A226D734_FOLCA|nr:hypothetical protein Fcan01_24381 [Folsomia candida]